MTDELTSPQKTVKEEIEALAVSCVNRALHQGTNLSTTVVNQQCHEWAMNHDFKTLMLVLDHVQVERDKGNDPSFFWDFWEPDNDVPFTTAVRYAADTAMRHAVMDHLGSREIGPFEPQDDYVFGEND